MERQFNTEQTAKLLGIKVRTVREWIKTGKLKASKHEGSRIYVVFESEIERKQKEMR